MPLMETLARHDTNTLQTLDLADEVYSVAIGGKYELDVKRRHTSDVPLAMSNRFS